MRDIHVGRIMTTEPSSVRADESAFEAQRLLADGNMHHLPVIDDAGRLVGIVSSSDFVKLYLLKGKPGKATVAHLMEEDPVTIASTANLRDAATHLSAGGFHALPVVEPDGTLVGIVTSSDLIVHLLQQIPRGDGSLRDPPPTDADDDTPPTGGTIGADDSAARTLLKLRDRNRVLEEVRQAAELYIRSGNGEHEHSVLIKRLADARMREDTPL